MQVFLIIIQLPSYIILQLQPPMLHNLHPSPAKCSSMTEQTSISSKKSSQCEKHRQDTELNVNQFKSTSKLNPEKLAVVMFEPSGFEKLLMLPFPFLMIGCCTSMTTILELDVDKKMVSITTYPGFLSCCKKDYEISFQDVLGSKMMVAFNRRIKKRQAYQLYLVTRIGDFELTPPKIREDAISSKNLLDDMLRVHGVWSG